MDAGKLKWRISLVRPAYTQDATGEPIVTRATYATLWAQRFEQRVAEVFSNSSDQVGREIVWRIRFRSDILSGDFVEFQGERFEIVSIAEVDFRRWMNLVCRRVGSSV